MEEKFSGNNNQSMVAMEIMLSASDSGKTAEFYCKKEHKGLSIVTLYAKNYDYSEKCNQVSLVKY